MVQQPFYVLIIHASRVSPVCSSVPLPQMLAERESQVQSLQAEHGHSVSSLRHEREQQLNALRQVMRARPCQCE